MRKLITQLVLGLVFFTVSCKGDQKKSEETLQEVPEQVLGETPEETATDQTETTPLDRELSNLIQVTVPEPGTEINSPLKITGQARGTWYFEGDFPIFLLDSNGKELGVAIAIAQGEWMTEDWVPFTATMEFQPPAVGDAELVFQKSNPSDKRELDRSYRMKVKF